MKTLFRLCEIWGLILLLNLGSFAQNFQLSPGDTLTSVKVHPDKKVTFKIYAPKSNEVVLSGPDIPNVMMIGKMIKLENGIWEVTVGPLAPGSYRYCFNIDGISVLDPRRPDVSESNTNSWSLIHIDGTDFMDLKDVSHGSVSEITYYSKSLNKFRRMHVYTPAGYEKNDKHYPVFYLLHGAFDCDDSWSSVGCAGNILDNLIAGNKAVPMIVVMPAGHTGPFRFGMTLNANKPDVDEFIVDFNNEIKPFIESHYRVLTGRENTAIAGLSMGGAHTLNIAVPNLAQYAYFGVFSSGVFGITGANSFGNNDGVTWEERNKATLDDSKLKEGLKLVWFATGKEDFLLETSRATVKTLENHGFKVTYKETDGGHTWPNWRNYLFEFAQLLFR